MGFVVDPSLWSNHKAAHWTSNYSYKAKDKTETEFSLTFIHFFF